MRREGNIAKNINRDERGVSLIAVLWIVAILTVLASEFMYSMQLEIRIARNWSDQVNAFYAAKAGLESAIILLKEDEEIASQIGYDALNEDWAQELAGDLDRVLGALQSALPAQSSFHSAVIMAFVPPRRAHLPASRPSQSPGKKVKTDNLAKQTLTAQLQVVLMD